MRWYQQIETYEYLQSEDYNRFWSRMGEMGEIIEWLLCNYLSDVDITGSAAGTSRNIKVTCWGSYAGQHRITPNRRQIVIRSRLGTRLFRGLPMVRMGDAEELREFIVNEANWDRDRQDIADLLRAPLSMDVDMADVDQAFTGYTIGPGSRGKKYRHATRSIRNQYVRKSIWKKEYCALFQSLKYNNKLKQLVRPPYSPTMLPDTLRPLIIQTLSLFVFLCFFLAIESENYKIMLENPFFSINFVYAISGYFLYLTFCVSLQNPLGIFGNRQRAPPLIATLRVLGNMVRALSAIFQLINLQVLSFLFLILRLFSDVEFDLRAELTIGFVYVIYLCSGTSRGTRDFFAFLCGMLVLYFPIPLTLKYLYRTLILGIF